MQMRTLGNANVAVSAIGLGCMGMSDFYGAADEGDSISVIHAALDRGANFFDTADMYGRGRNEDLLGRAIADRRNEAFVATKFGVVRVQEGPARGINGRPEYVRSACEGSLKRLKIDTIDLYYQHRVDVSVPIEETVGEMSLLVREGKVRFLGLSEASTETIRRAHAVHPIAALQSEYSLWSREPEEDHMAVLRELNIALVAYSPLGRGFLTGEIRKIEDLAADDWRRENPRFMGANFQKNLDLVERIHAMARAKQCTSAQLALAWLLQQDPLVIPIPGTTRLSRLDENLGALDVKLTAQELAEIDAVFPAGAAAGERYPEGGMKSVNR
ncbi:aldo/keto reductase [soil metagenome]